MRTALDDIRRLSESLVHPLGKNTTLWTKFFWVDRLQTAEMALR